MPSAAGKFRGIAVPRVPWHEDKPKAGRLTPPAETCSGCRTPNSCRILACRTAHDAMRERHPHR